MLNIYWFEFVEFEENRAILKIIKKKHIKKGQNGQKVLFQCQKLKW